MSKRDAISIELDGLLLHGTRHRGLSSLKRGILFLNSGAQPRCSRGDLNVRLADALADDGFDCFRFDLPGLGDSEGDLPREYLDLYRFVQEGGYASPAARLAQVLLESHSLTDIALAGICGGASSAVFAAAKLPPRRLSGLILLDLPFFCYRAAAPPNSEDRTSIWRRGRQVVKRCEAGLHDWILASRWEPYITAWYRRMKRLVHTADPLVLPPDTNPPLLNTLSQLLRNQVPTLLITARPEAAATPGFDYIAYLQKIMGAKLSCAEIRGTTHSFVENGGPEAVLDEVTKWLNSLESTRLQHADPIL